ncbi:MAG: PAS domain S-box protein [Deltaproteobacteria bacterium]|nr:PAS domain S-box protein [Deltaproteobacteria bacterium]
MQNPQRPFTSADPDAQSADKLAPVKGRAQVPFLWLLGPLAIVAIYLLDMWMPSHLTIPFCYVATLVLLVAVAGKREKLLIAGVCSAILIIDFYFLARNPMGLAWAQGLSHGLAIVMIWSVTTLGWRHASVEESMRANQRIANERLALINTIYVSAPVGLCFLDRELRYVSVNNALAEMAGHPPDFYLGKLIRDAVPELAEVIEAHHHRVIESGQPVVDVEVNATTQAQPNEQRYWLSSYYPVRDQTGELLGVNVAVRDITRRKQADANALFLLDVGECIRFAADGDELLWAVSIALGEHLRASRCVFVAIDGDQDRIVVQRDYHPHMPSLIGSYSLSSLAPALLDAGRLGQTIVVNDIGSDPRTAAIVEPARRFGIGAAVAVPLVRDGQLISAIIVAMAHAHEWNEREVALINLVAERTWEAVQKLQLDSALRESDAALRDADRRKDEFLATLAHELRNPLSLMRNVVTLQQSAGTPHADPK